MARDTEVTTTWKLRALKSGQSRVATSFRPASTCFSSSSSSSLGFSLSSYMNIAGSKQCLCWWLARNNGTRRSLSDFAVLLFLLFLALLFCLPLRGIQKRRMGSIPPGPPLQPLQPLEPLNCKLFREMPDIRKLTGHQQALFDLIKPATRSPGAPAPSAAASAGSCAANKSTSSCQHSVLP